MKIAVLNFPFDNNYGGNLQRYALIHVLQDLGHEVTHLYTTLGWKIPGRYPIFTIAKRIGLRLLQRNTAVFLERAMEQEYQNDNKHVLPFYNKYVPHTARIIPGDDLTVYNDYDAYIVGSDQVWRRSMSYVFPFHTMLLSFVEKLKGIRRIAYGVSFGNSKDEIPVDEKPYLNHLYKLFDAVSVREDSGLQMLDSLGWTKPEAIQVLDPTLLLPKEHYIGLINKGKTRPSEGNLFCYVLDSNEEVEQQIKAISESKKLKAFCLSLESDSMVSVEQWLRSFMDAEHVVTDSFHGFVFSIIFNKPVTLTYNKRRGNDRFESLMRCLQYNPEVNEVDWKQINLKIQEWGSKSKEFLIQNLK